MSDEFTTLDPRDPPRVRREGRRIAATILCHPDLARIGERAVLETDTKLSRLEPVFQALGHAAPAGQAAQTLDDASVSRRAITLRVEGDALVVSPPSDGVNAHLDGTPLTTSILLEPTRLIDGVVLELGAWVAVLLHAVPIGLPAPHAHGLVGESDAVQRLRREIDRVATLDVPVLLRGESGTGKELVARALHLAGRRAHGPCIAVNLGAVPVSTAASQLFGHARGAFSGAAADHRGYFSEADGGTLFLDEIGEAGLDVQVILLRALENGEIQPLGAARPRHVDVRLVTATDADLDAAVAAGSFRTALLHRLASYQINIAPLRTRRDDIPRLLLHFLRDELGRMGEASRLASRPREAHGWLPARLVAQLCRHPWPGNVRELRNVARRLAVASRDGEAFDIGMIEDLLGASARKAQRTPFAAGSTVADSTPSTPRVAPSALTEDEVIGALRECAWAPGAAATRLGISRTTLDTLIARSSRVRKAQDIPAEEIRARLAACHDDLDDAARLLEVSKRALVLRLRQLGLRQ